MAFLIHSLDYSAAVLVDAVVDDLRLDLCNESSYLRHLVLLSHLRDNPLDHVVSVEVKTQLND